MRENYLLKTPGARRLYEQFAASLPIIDFHNHVCVAEIAADRRFETLTDLWLAPDPYKHRLMRIFGIEEHFITGDISPHLKFQKFCEIFPLLAGNPVYDWSRMELSRVFGIEELPSGENADRLFDMTKEMLASPEFSCRGILDRFSIAYQSPVASITDDLSLFDGKQVAPSLRGDNLLSPTEALKEELSQKTGITISDTATYLAAISVMLDRFAAAGCRFADHALDADFFADHRNDGCVPMLERLGREYAKRGWTLLLHMNAKRKTSPRLAELAGPVGGYAAVGGGFDLSALADMFGRMEKGGDLPDTVLFPLNMSDQAPLAVMQGSFSEDGTPSKVQLGPAWWWCDHAMGIRNTLSAVASFGAVAQFIGMTTDSRSILSFVRHEYFRRLLCSWVDEQNTVGEWELPWEVQGRLVQMISHDNAWNKIHHRTGGNK